MATDVGSPAVYGFSRMVQWMLVVLGELATQGKQLCLFMSKADLLSGAEI